MSNYSTKNLLKTTFVISIGSVGAGVIKMVNVLFLTYFVSADQMGDYDLAITYASLAYPLVCLAIYEGVFRWMLDENASKESVARTSLVIMGVSVALFEIVAIPSMILLGYRYAKEAAFLVAAECLNNYMQYALRGLHRNKLFAYQGIVYAIALVIANIALVVVLPLQASGLMWSVVAAGMASSLFALLSVKYVSRYAIKGRFSKELASKMLKYSIPLMPNTTAWWLVSSSNRLIINWFIGPAANGIFAISNRFPSILNTFTRFFYQAWQEQALSVNENRGRDAYYSHIFNLYARILLSGTVLLLPLSKLAIMLLSADYLEAYQYLCPLYLSCAFSAMSAFYGIGYLSSRKTVGAFTTTVIGAVVNISFTIVAINAIGLYAAAIGNMLGNLVIWLARIVQTRHYFRIRLDMPWLIALLVACMAMHLALRVNGWQVLGISTVISAVFFLAVNHQIIGKGFHAVKGKLNASKKTN